MSLHITYPPVWHTVWNTACLSSPNMGVPTTLNTRGKQSQQGANRTYATEVHTTHASPLKATGTLYRTQFQSYENITYQAHSEGYGKLLPLVAHTSE